MKKFLEYYTVVIVYLFFVFLMLKDWIEDNPALQNRPTEEHNTVMHITQSYGHNQEGALWMGLLLLSVELLVFYRIIKPWSFDKSYERVAIAVSVFLLWAFVSLLMSMHAGGIFLLHFLWVFSLIILALSFLFKKSKVPNNHGNRFFSKP